MNAEQLRSTHAAQYDPIEETRLASSYAELSKLHLAFRSTPADAEEDDADLSGAAMLSPDDHTRIMNRLASMRPALELIGGDVRSPRRNLSAPSHVHQADTATDSDKPHGVVVPEKSQFELAHKKQRETEMKRAARRMTMMEDSERALREEHKRKVEAGVVETDEEKSVRRKRMREMRRTRKAAKKRARKTRKQISHNVRRSQAQCMRLKAAGANAARRCGRVAAPTSPVLTLCLHATRTALPVPRHLAGPDGN